MSKRELVLSTTKVPPDVRLLCGNPPVLSTEKRKDYESLFGHMAECVKPTDAIEWLWLKDVVDHTWEIRRLRRFKDQLIEVGLPSRQDDALHKDPLANAFEAWDRASKQYSEKSHDERDDSNEKKISDKRKIRKTRPSEADAVCSLRQCIDDYQTLDRLLISAEDRRNAALREIDRRRDGLAQRLRQASDEVIDAEFSETAVAAE